MAAKKRASGASGGTGTGRTTRGKSEGDRPKLHSSHGARGLLRPRGEDGTAAPIGVPRKKRAAGTAAKATKARKPLADRSAPAARPARRGAEAPAAAVRRPAPRRTEADPAPPLPAVKGIRKGPRLRGGPAGATPPSSLASDGARELAVAIAIAALDKKAVGLEILDVAGKVDYADFLVLMTGRSDRQVAALADGIEEALRVKDRHPVSVEGKQRASWVLMDYGDVVVHVFQDDARSLYDIEGLWLDARRIPVPLPEGI